ncbi:AEC family transporter [Pseudoflavonifractor phocaeensis]|uniref:AEC family transporter n=1 Tax=Pseudoflavonifractor phocaeensis TaxID=1870988 RepID=UPI001F22618B|nr:AEC family transporter [Pseudoflavonifractor phocaeensis]MCF2662460.1 AEC family transporter [Pseudoflavonifractor phocaeensis]
MSVTVLLSSLVGLFLLIGVGFLAVRTKVLSASASAPLTALLMKITLPATIVLSMLRPFDPSFLRDALVLFAIGFVFHLSYIGISWLLARLFRVPQGRRGMWNTCCAFCNNGFMGYPVAYAIFGEEGLALAVMLGVPFNLLLYTLGAKMVSLDGSGAGETRVSWKKVIFSMINLAIVVGLVLYCFQVSVSEVVKTPLQHLANVTTPLSMFITGMNLAANRVADVVRDRDAITASLTRLVLLPLATWGVLSLLPIANPMVVGVTLVIMSMPSAVATVVLGEQYGGCTQLAARTVCLSSLLCVVTIPLMVCLL